MPLYNFAPTDRKVIPVLGIYGPGQYELKESDAARFPDDLVLVEVVAEPAKRGPGRPPKADKAEPAADKAEG